MQYDLKTVVIFIAILNVGRS